MLDTRGEEVNWSLDQLVSVPSLTCDLGKVKVTDRNSRKEFVLWGSWALINLRPHKSM